MIALVKEAIGTMEPIFGACISAIKKGLELIPNFRSLERDMGNLRSRMDVLSAIEYDVTEAVEKEEEQGKKRKRVVDLWQKNVKRIKNEVNVIEGNVREERWLWRPKLRKNIEDLTIEVARLQRASAFPDGVAMEPLVSRGSPQPTATLLSESANKTLKKIWDLLLDVKIKTVGVFGTAGVGKTTIMKHIHNQLLESHVFRSIIWVTVSKALDMQRLQCEIANAIGLDLSNDYGDSELRSLKLCAALSRTGRCLLILDDLWEAFSLVRIGIPEPTQTNGFKLVITSRSLQVCRVMESERIVEVEVLSDYEAWILFQEKVGDCALGFPKIEPIAKAIAEECGCLPLALITVGRALRGVGNVPVWRNALDELKRSYADFAGLDHVFSRLMFSYQHLRNDTLKGCFLYCALYPEDYKIDAAELIENWAGEGLLDGGDWKEEKDKGYKILSELKDACMIEDADHEDGTVKLHDLIRDLAIIITRRKPRFVVKVRLELKESPRVEEWAKDSMRVSLMYNKIEVLSGQPMCPALCTLLLQRNECLREISSLFFEFIRGLKVLNLSHTSIESLPDGISNLEELRVLRLSHCQQLKMLPSVAKLKQLRVLQLSDTAIEELPQGMEELVNLRYLDLSHTYKLQMLSVGFLSKLSLLEVFLMIDSRWRWASKSVEEIGSLTRLANLSLSFDDVLNFNIFVRIVEKLQLLESFIVTVGRENALWPIQLYTNNAVAVVGVRDALSPLSCLMLPYNTVAFQIHQCDSISRLSQLPCLANVTQIKYCEIGTCCGMEFIVMADENTSPSLETLHLYDLPNLRALSDGNSPVRTFANLKSLVVWDCNKMKSLLTIGLLLCLRNLESIQVGNCNSMEDIVADDGNDPIYNFSFAKLKKLELTHLEKLKSIWNTEFSPPLVCVKIIGCQQLKKLPFTHRNMPADLKEFQGEEEWWNALEWEDSIAKTCLQYSFVAYNADCESDT